MLIGFYWTLVLVYLAFDPGWLNLEGMPRQRALIGLERDVKKFLPIPWKTLAKMIWTTEAGRLSFRC
jgi:hypothetical protein